MISDIAFDAATVALGWSVGGLGSLALTARRGEVGLGYGWLLRSIYGGVALLGFAAALRWPNDSTAAAALTAVATLGVGLAALGALAASSSRTARSGGLLEGGRHVWLDAAPALLGGALLVAIGVSQAAAAELSLGAASLHTARLVVGAAFLGALTNSMLLGHWYLVQPGLRRAALLSGITAVLVLWPLEVALLLVPQGMTDVLSGSIDDGYSGLLGWTWVVCAVSTVGLVWAARAALAERAYAAVMAATGLLYLAILTGFGTDLVARMVLAA